MSREEIQKLLGGYATDTLSEAERRTLFEAALEDQELFDALAKEQPLREVLQDPAARRQLIEALGPAREPFAARAWHWLRQPAVLAMAGGAAVLLIAAGIVLRQTKHAARQEVMVADAIAPTPPAAIPSSAAPSSARLPESAPSKTAPLKKMKPRVVGGNPERVAPLPASPVLAAPPAAPQPVAVTVAAGAPALVPPPRAAPSGGLAGTPEATQQVMVTAQAPVVQNFIAGAKAPLAPMRGKIRASPPARPAVQYSLLLKGADGTYSPVPSGTAFHAGDSVRVQIEPGEDGYAFLLQRDASARWKLVASQQIEKGQRYELPSTGGLESDVPARLEVLLVHSRLQNIDVDAPLSAAQGTSAITIEFR